MRGRAAFVDGPDNQALPAAHIARGEDARYAGGVFARLGAHIAALIPGNAKLFQQHILGAKEPHRQQNQLRRPDFFGAWDFTRRRASVCTRHPLHLDGMDRGQVAVFVTHKALG